MADDVITNFGFALLELGNDALQFLNAALLQLACKEATGAVVFRKRFDFLIVVDEECQVLETHINVGIATIPTLLF